MKTKKLTPSRLDFPIVTSLDNLEVGRIYRTYNPNIIEHLSYNRGTKEGYVPERVAALQAKYDAGLFLMDVCHVLVNLNRKCIDGNNRIKMLSNNKAPINFMLTAQPEFNLEDESEILNNVSDYNSINSIWNGNDSYESALSLDAPAAVAIDNIKVWIGNESVIAGNIFTPSRLLALALKDKSGLAGKIQTRRAYCNKETATILESPEFKNLLLFIISVIQFVQSNNNSITEWFVIRCMMPEIWKHDLSLKVLLRNTKKCGFKKMDNTKMAGVKTRVNKILKMENI